MSVSKEKIEEEIKFYENQKEQAKEIFVKSVGSIEALNKLLQEKKEKK